MRMTNPDSLRNCLCFQVLRLSFASDFFNLLLVGFRHVVKNRIQWRNSNFLPSGFIKKSYFQPILRQLMVQV